MCSLLEVRFDETNRAREEELTVALKRNLLDYFRKEKETEKEEEMAERDNVRDSTDNNNNVIAIEENSRPLRENNSKNYKDRRIEIVEYCKRYGNKQTLLKYGGIGLKKQTLSDWMRAIEKGQPIGAKPRGKKNHVPEKLREELLEVVREIRSAGQEVHLQTIVNHIQAIVIQHNMTSEQLRVKLDKNWARRWAVKNGYANRRATKAKMTKEFTEESREEFLMKIALTVHDNKINQELVVIFDETGINLCPTSKTTYNLIGEKQVILAMLDDKRQYTLGLGMLRFSFSIDDSYLFFNNTFQSFLFWSPRAHQIGVTMSGEKLNPQIIFEGTTTRCLPKGDGWDGLLFCHSSNHWQDLNTTREWINSVLIPWYASSFKFCFI